MIRKKVLVVLISRISWLSKPKVEKILLGFDTQVILEQSREPKNVAWVSPRIS
jgi:hypothetical protein